MILLADERGQAFNRRDMNKNIVLIGMPTSGKSTVGVIIAKILGMDFIDTDIVIQQREGRILSEIIAERGTDGFIECEKQALLSVNASNTVIATGGSAVYGREAMEHLKEDSVVVYLKVEKSELFGRLKNVKERGVVLKPGETLDRMFDARAKLYAEYADLTVEEDGTIEDSVNAVLKALESWK